MTGLAIWAAVALGPALAWLTFRGGGYKRVPAPRPEGPGWERTAERFVDPTSGEALVVWYCARTGERAYVRTV